MLLCFFCLLFLHFCFQSQIPIYTLLFEGLASVRFFLKMFFKEVACSHQGCIYMIKKTERNYCGIFLQIKITVFYFNILSNIIYSCDKN